jgi:hypothetical protein
MSEISKQALKVDNSQSFPDNNAGAITPSDLRAFNVNMIDSLVDEIGYNVDSASWNNSVSRLNTFTSSQQPSFNALNSFTASQLSINTGVNSFTQSANGRLNNIEQYTASFTSSVEIYDESTLVSDNIDKIAFSGNGISASYVSGKAVVSVNFTPLNQFTASTSQSLYQLQDNFNTFTQSTDNSIALIEQVTASYATTGSNTFTQNQNFEKNISVTQSVYVGGNIYVDGGIEARYIQTIYETASVIYSSGSNQLGDEPLDTQILSGSTFVEGQLYVNKLNVTDQFALINSFTASQLVINSGYNTYTQSTNADLDAIHQTTSSLNSYSASNTQRVDVLSSFTASYATTGSNVFTGDQTLTDASGNFYTITDASGSMMLVAKSFTSASAHFTSSGNFVNVIFKTNDGTNDTVISGSGNIFANQASVTAGFKRYVGGNFNIFAGATSVPQISGSMGFSPIITTNYLAGAMSMRGPVSSSAWTITQNNILGTVNIGSSAVLNAERLTSGIGMSQNYIGGTLSVIANQSFLTSSANILSGNNINGAALLALSSSAVIFSNNTINDNAFVFNNQYWSSSVGLGQSTVAKNTIAGTSNIITISGSQATGTINAPSVIDNILGGGANIIYVDVANARVSGSLSYNNTNRSIIYGQGLIVSASSFVGDLSSQGSAFFGRYNSIDGTKDLSAETIFAVGTGNTTTRKTGFLIDSGSNTFVEGTLNISGAIYNNVVSMSVNAQTASLDMSLGSYFTLSLPTGTSTNINVTNNRPGMTAMLQITTATNASASFSTNIKQPAGFAYVPSTGSGAIDLITLASFSTSSVFVANVTNLV